MVNVEGQKLFKELGLNVTLDWRDPEVKSTFKRNLQNAVNEVHQLGIGYGSNWKDHSHSPKLQEQAEARFQSSLQIAYGYKNASQELILL